MAARLEVVPHPTGPWLVKIGTKMYAAPAAVAQQVARWQGRIPTAEELLECPAPAGVDPDRWQAFMALLAGSVAGDGDPGRLPPPIWLRIPLLPARVVRPVAEWLRPLAAPGGLALLVLVGLVGYGHLALTCGIDPIGVTSGQFAVALFLFAVTAVWHELGHATALAFHSYPPGGIGTGLLYVIPVLFADVTAVGALSRPGRLRVDAAGVVFQFGMGGVLCLWGGGVAAPLAATLALFAVGWSLFPFVRADGYWLVCDWLGIAELEGDPEPRPSGRLRLFLRVYRLANAAFLLLVGFYMPFRYAHFGSVVSARLGLSVVGTIVSVPLLVLAITVLGIVWWNILRRVVRLVRA